MENISSTLNNQFLDEDDALYQMLIEYEDDEEDTSSSDDDKEFVYKATSETNLYRYLKTELQILEPSRSKLRFKVFGSNVTYEGKVLKEIDKDNFIFLLDKPEKKMKKIKIDDIEVLV